MKKYYHILYITLFLYSCNSNNNNNAHVVENVDASKNVEVSVVPANPVENKVVFNLDKLIGLYNYQISKIMGGYAISSTTTLTISKINNEFFYSAYRSTIDEYNNYKKTDESFKGSLILNDDKIIFQGGEFGNRGAYITINSQNIHLDDIKDFVINFSPSRGNPMSFNKVQSIFKPVDPSSTSKEEKDNSNSNYKIFKIDDFTVKYDLSKKYTWDEVYEYNNQEKEWILPTIEELEIIYKNKNLIGIKSGMFWSSTIGTPLRVGMIYYIDFNTGEASKTNGGENYVIFIKKR